MHHSRERQSVVLRNVDELDRVERTTSVCRIRTGELVPVEVG
jgi:hypothetical protein